MTPGNSAVRVVLRRNSHHREECPGQGSSYHSPHWGLTIARSMDNTLAGVVLSFLALVWILRLVRKKPTVELLPAPVSPMLLVPLL